MGPHQRRIRAVFARIEFLMNFDQTVARGIPMVSPTMKKLAIRLIEAFGEGVTDQDVEGAGYPVKEARRAIDEVLAFSRGSTPELQAVVHPSRPAPANPVKVAQQQAEKAKEEEQPRLTSKAPLEEQPHQAEEEAGNDEDLHQGEGVHFVREPPPQGDENSGDGDIIGYYQVDDGYVDCVGSAELCKKHQCEVVDAELTDELFALVTEENVEEELALIQEMNKDVLLQTKYGCGRYAKGQKDMNVPPPEYHRVKDFTELVFIRMVDGDTDETLKIDVKAAQLSDDLKRMCLRVACDLRFKLKKGSRTSNDGKYSIPVLRVPAGSWEGEKAGETAYALGNHIGGWLRAHVLGRLEARNRGRITLLDKATPLLNWGFVAKGAAWCGENPMKGDFALICVCCRRHFSGTYEVVSHVCSGAHLAGLKCLLEEAGKQESFSEEFFNELEAEMVKKDAHPRRNITEEEMVNFKPKIRNEWKDALQLKGGYQRIAWSCLYRMDPDWDEEAKKRMDEDLIPVSKKKKAEMLGLAPAKTQDSGCASASVEPAVSAVSDTQEDTQVGVNIGTNDKTDRGNGKGESNESYGDEDGWKDDGNWYGQGNWNYRNKPGGYYDHWKDSGINDWQYDNQHRGRGRGKGKGKYPSSSSGSGNKNKQQQETGSYWNK